MSTLSMNLKHLYQRKGFLLTSLVLVMFAPLGIQLIVDRKAGAFLVIAAWIYIAGIFTAAMQVEILARPFSWVLPGHERVPRKFLFCVGWTLCALWAGIFLLADGGAVEKCVRSVSVFFMASAVFWLTVWIVMRFPNWVGAIALFPLAMYLLNLFDLGKMFETVSTQGWAAVAVCGVVINLTAWRALGRHGLGRKYCARAWMGAFDAWDKEKAMQYWQARVVDRRKEFWVEVPRVDEFFLSRMRRTLASSTERYVWGAIYRTFGAALCRKRVWMGFAMTTVLVCGVMGYMGPAADVLFVMSGLMVMQMRLGLRSTMLVAGGRRERFIAALILGVTTAIMATAFVTALAGVTVVLEPIMPKLQFGGGTLTYGAMHPELFIVPLIMIPFTFTASLIFWRYPRLALGVVMLSFVVAFQIPVFQGYLSQFSPGPTGVAIIVISLLLGTWAIFCGVLRNICMRRCLVS